MRDQGNLRVWEELPEGVRIVKDYRSGSTLLECDHAQENQRPTGGWAAVQGPQMVGIAREPIILQAITMREATEQLPVGYRLDYGGKLVCCVCGADEIVTEAFTKPVKMLVKLAPAARKAKQEELF